jgi:hypothetical protein
MRHPVPPGSIAMLREAQMSGGPQIALNRGPLVTCLCQRVGKDTEVWRSGCGLDPIERPWVTKMICQHTCSPSYARARKGQEERQMLCAVWLRLGAAISLTWRRLSSRDRVYSAEQ